tara:strand:+ start:260 stop:430 length:171 start_codon:yes stop_codon:yes gene_type:complete
LPLEGENIKSSTMRETFPGYAPILTNDRGKRLAKLIEGQSTVQIHHPSLRLKYNDN